MFSQKDRSENMITGKLIKDAFNSLEDEGLLEKTKSSDDAASVDPVFFIRRLRHLQHLCQSVDGVMKNQDSTVGKQEVAVLTVFTIVTSISSLL